MDILSLIVSCSMNANVNLELLSIIEVVSKNNPYFVYDPHTRSRYNLDDEKQAARISEKMQSYGAGLTAISSEYMQSNSIEKNEIFEGCKNIKIASEILTKHQLQCLKNDPKNPLCTLQKYGQQMQFNPAYLETTIEHFAKGSLQENTLNQETFNALTSGVYFDQPKQPETGLQWNSDSYLFEMPFEVKADPSNDSQKTPKNNPSD